MDDQRDELKSVWMAIEALSIAAGVTGTTTQRYIADSGRDPAEVLNEEGIKIALFKMIEDAHDRLVDE